MSDLHRTTIRDIAHLLENSGIPSITELKITDEESLEQITDIDVFAVYRNIVLMFEVKGTSDKIKAKIRKAQAFETIIKSEEEHFQSVIKAQNHGIWAKYKEFKTDHLFVPILVDPEQAILALKQNASVKGWGRDDVEYFKIISRNALGYTKYELFESLEVKPSYILDDDDEEAETKAHGVLIEETQQWTIVSFRMRVRKLLRRSMILRYDGWAQTKGGFQRMLNDRKLRGMRDYLLEEKSSYPNNIIVIANSTVSITDKNKKTGTCLVHFPDSFGNFQVVDGQHRLFSFTQDNYSEKYKGKVDAREERKLRHQDKRIKQMAAEKYLSITCIQFRKSEQQILKASKLFLDVNTMQTRIPGDSILDVYTNIGSKIPRIQREIRANKLIKRLNDEGQLVKKFKIKFYDRDKVARPSLIRYGGLSSIFDENSMLKLAHSAINGNLVYETFIVKLIDIYFSALHQCLSDRFGVLVSDTIWKDTAQKKYMLMSVTSLSGFFRLLSQFFFPTDVDYKRLISLLGDMNSNRALISEYFKARLRLIIDEIKFDRETWASYEFKSSQFLVFVNRMKNLIREGGFQTFGESPATSTIPA
ncbi:MAG: ParB N-terminal domain-containing protein [Nitrososphaerales archaeon]